MRAAPRTEGTDQRHGGWGALWGHTPHWLVLKMQGQLAPWAPDKGAQPGGRLLCTHGGQTENLPDSGEGHICISAK